MAYTAPTFDASAQTWAQLKTLGFSGYVTNYMAALTSETPDADANLYRGMLKHPNTCFLVMERAKNIVDNYLNGASDKTSAKNQIYDLQLVFGSIATALGEIGVLVDAN